MRRVLVDFFRQHDETVVLLLLADWLSLGANAFLTHFGVTVLGRRGDDLLHLSFEPELIGAHVLYLLVELDDVDRILLLA